MLYMLPEGVEAWSTENDFGIATTLPRAIHQQLKKRLIPPTTESANFPLASIPEGDVPEAQILPEERIEDDNPNDEPDSDHEAIVPPAGFTPSESQLRDLHLPHDYSGHPSNADFVRLLRRGNCRPEIAAWVRKNFSCEACEANQLPKARRPSAVPRSYRVNHVVGIDLIFIPKQSGDGKAPWRIVACWGSIFQQVMPVAFSGGESKRPEQILKCMHCDVGSIFRYARDHRMRSRW